MYRRIKDESKVITKLKLKAGNSHYYHVFLWEDQESFDLNTMDNTPGRCSGCVNLAPTIMCLYTNGKEEEIVRPKLGEIHFIEGKWDMEVVTHELCHALIHRLRVLKPTIQNVVDQDDTCEEDICYEFGNWCHQIYSILWETTKVFEKKKVGGYAG